MVCPGADGGLVLAYPYASGSQKGSGGQPGESLEPLCSAQPDVISQLFATQVSSEYHFDDAAAVASMWLALDCASF